MECIGNILKVDFGQPFWKSIGISSTVAAVLSYTAYKFIQWRKNQYIDDVTKKCVLVTGCDSGFGRALAKQLDKLGCPVFAACLTTDGAKSVDTETSDGTKVLILDVTSQESVNDALEYVTKNIPEGAVFWGLVNNAEIMGNVGPIEFVDKVDYEQVMQVNFFGMVDMIKRFLPLLKNTKGRIVNLATCTAIFANPNSAPYISSKFAVLGYSTALRREKHMWGIHVSSILPGYFATNITNLEIVTEKKRKHWESLPQEVRTEYGAQYITDVETQTENMYKKFAKDDLSPVTNAIEHALFSTRPQNLYKPGLDSKIIILLETLSFGFWDRFMCDPKGFVPLALKSNYK